MRNVLPLIPLLCTSALANPGPIGNTVAANVLGSPECGVLNVTLNAHPERIELLGVRSLDDPASHERCRALTRQLAGKKVLVMFPPDVRQFADHKRANVFSKDRRLVAAELLKLGYAQATSVLGNPFNSALAMLSQAAHARRVGAWR